MCTSDKNLALSKERPSFLDILGSVTWPSVDRPSMQINAIKTAIKVLCGLNRLLGKCTSFCSLYKPLISALFFRKDISFWVCE